MSPEAHDLIEKLLTSDPQHRLGANGVESIKSHPFFKGIEWNKVKEMPAPFKPAGRDQDT